MMSSADYLPCGQMEDRAFFPREKSRPLLTFLGLTFFPRCDPSKGLKIRKKCGRHRSSGMIHSKRIELAPEESLFLLFHLVLTYF